MDRSHALIGRWTERAVAGIALGLLLVGCAEGGGPEDRGPEAVLAAEVISAPGATGVGFGDVERAVNGVRGGGRWQGGLDVFSIGVEEELILGFDAPVSDRDGPDLAVFENPFEIRSGGSFFDPVVVEGSPDCERFVAFPFRYEGDPSVFAGDPTEWIGFAGLTPVVLHEEEAPVDPLSEEAGGDRFDLADLDPDDPTAAEILEGGLSCVRLTAAVRWSEPKSGLPYPADPVSNGPDIDGVYAAP